MNSITSITKDWKNKLGYMAFGCLCAVIGGALSSVTAQRDASGELRCTRLIVEDSFGQPRVMLTSDDNGGLIAICNPHLEPTVTIGNKDTGGYIQMYDNSGNKSASLESGDNGGLFLIRGEHRKHAGFLCIRITDDGDAEIGTADRNGNVTFLP